MKTIRGQKILSSLPVHWRVDGAATDPRAPLVVCLHGMGMNEDLFALLLQPLFALPFAFLLPRAPYALPGGKGGQIRAGWYIYDGDQPRFLEALARGEETVLELLRELEAELGLEPRARVMLGFSQGGYLGAWTALRHPELFAGMVVASARVKSEALETEMRIAARTGFAALICHGLHDRAVKPEAATRSREALEAAGVEVELRMSEGGHTLGRHEVAAIADWLRVKFG